MPTFTNSSTGPVGTIQSWTVPATGPYKIECWGAQGGSSTNYGGIPGKGAYRYGSMNLTAGQVVKIIVGQQGGTSFYDGGGGGGSFVYVDATNDLLCAAGGGGGTGYSGAMNGGDGGTGTSGTTGSGGTPGSNGNGGSGGQAPSGAGWLGNGGTGSWGTPPYAGSACKPGLSYTQSVQARGGDAYTNNNGRADGGYGGGGGSHSGGIGGAGGGGYSGGAGGTSGGGGGGGSFVHASMTSTGGTAGTRTGHGQVVITALNAPPVASITNPTASQKVDPRLPLQVTWSYSDAEGQAQAQAEVSWIGLLLTPDTPNTFSPTYDFGRLGTIQSWTVSTSGLYRITARGASGQGNGTLNGGRGAKVTGDFLLTAGDVIQVLAGQRGDSASITTAAGQGGGGGSFVYNQTTATLLLAAGGGGGAGGTTAVGYQGCDASLTTAPNNTTGTVTIGTDAAPGQGGAGPYYAGGGAGWDTDGGDVQGGDTDGRRFLHATEPGRGGFGYSGNATSYAGGFGGGGGGSSTGDTAGGGGGYTGGNGGSTTDYPGGGGGSFNGGLNPTAVLHDSYTDSGLVTAQRIGSVTTVPISGSAGSYSIAANTLADESAPTIRVRVNDGTSWSAYATVSITSDSWNYVTEVTSAIQTDVDLPELVAGLYEAQVRTSDQLGYGPWSGADSFEVYPTSSTKIREAGAWRTVPLFVRVGGQWVPLKKQRMS